MSKTNAFRSNFVLQSHLNHACITFSRAFRLRNILIRFNSKLPRRQMASKVQVIRVNRVIKAPLKFVYDWCTDFRETYRKIIGSARKRMIIEKTRKRVVFAQVWNESEGKTRVNVDIVTLSPPDSWHLDMFLALIETKQPNTNSRVWEKTQHSRKFNSRTGGERLQKSRPQNMKLRDSTRYLGCIRRCP